MAGHLVRRHRLAEHFLIRIIGLPWHRAHQEAERWERVISDEVEERMVAILNDPATCPHGFPIPEPETVPFPPEGDWPWGWAPAIDAQRTAEATPASKPYFAIMVRSLRSSQGWIR